MRRVAPSLFTADGTGKGTPAATAIRVAGSVFSPVSVFDPIDLGGDIYVSLYGTGIRNRATVACTIGGVSVPVLYAGPQLVYAGLDQVNIQLTPALRGIGEVDLVVTVDGQPSNPVRINVR